MKKISLIFLLFISVFGFSQTLSSNLSKNKIELGEKATFTISINHLQEKKIISAPKNELLPFHFEEIKDEVEQTPENYTRTIDFQVFDEGKFTIPALQFSVGGEILKTIPYEIDVYNPVNSTDQIKDIMNNKQVDLSWKDYWLLYKFYALAIIAIVLIVFLLYVFKKNGVFKKGFKKEITSTNKTLIALENLKKKKFIENGNYRSFYVEIIDISREFISKQYHIPADVLLTDDLIDLMKKTNKISQENEKIVEKVFLRGDLVKFAKTFPDQETMTKDFDEISEFVKRSYKDIEIEKLRENV